MKAVILAGGRGTRLSRITHGAVPKPMAELLGAPMLEHIVALLKRHGFRDLCCTVAYLGEQIERYFGDGSGFGVRMQYRREEKALGTAGAVKNCEDFIAGESVLIISGDAACDFDLRALWNEHRRTHAAVTMALYPHEAPLPYGLAVTDTDGWVRSFIEKPAWERVVTDLVNTGVYILSPEALRFIPADTPFDFARDLFPRLMASGRGIRGVAMEGYWRDIGDPGSYYRANLDAWEGKLRLPEQPQNAAERPANEAPERARYACRVYFDAPHRARLMRSLTAGLMEAGADLADGLTVRSVPGGVHIAPCVDRAALCIESDSPDTARRFEALVRDVERRTERERGGIS